MKYCWTDKYNCDLFLDLDSLWKRVRETNKQFSECWTCVGKWFKATSRYSQLMPSDVQAVCVCVFQMVAWWLTCLVLLHSTTSFPPFTNLFVSFPNFISASFSFSCPLFFWPPLFSLNLVLSSFYLILSPPFWTHPFMCFSVFWCPFVSSTLFSCPLSTCPPPLMCRPLAVFYLLTHSAFPSRLISRALLLLSNKCVTAVFVFRPIKGSRQIICKCLFVPQTEGICAFSVFLS